MKFSRFVLIVPIAFFCIFFLYPLCSILIRSLIEDGSLNLVPFQTIAKNEYYLNVIWFSIWQAFVSTLLSILLGMPLAYVFAKHEFPGKTFFKALTTLPFVMPTIVVAVGFMALLGPHGIVNSTLMNVFNMGEPPIRINNSLTIIFMAHAFYNYAIVVRIVSALWANLDPNLENAAAVLGAGPLSVFRQVTMPILLPAITSSALLAFTFSFTSFGVILILGGPQFSTIEVAIYELTAKLFRLPLASALSLIQLFFTFIFLSIYARFQTVNPEPVELKPRKVNSRKTLRLRDKVFLITMLLYLLIILSPLFGLLIHSINLMDGYTLGEIIRLFADEHKSYFYLSPVMIIWNSVRFALMTVIISVFLGTIVAYLLSRSKHQGFSLLDALFMLPIGVSAITLGLGYLISLNNSWLDLRDSWILLVVAHSLVAYPFVIRSILPVLRKMSPRLKEAAMTLGASPTKIFLLIDMPILTPALIVGATFAFAVSMGEFGATLLLIRPESTTIPVAIFRYLGLPGSENLIRSLIMSSLLMIIVAVGFIVIEKFRYKDTGVF